MLKQTIHLSINAPELKLGEDLGKMKLNRPEGRNYGRNSWWWAKHAWLFSDLIQVLTGEHLLILGSQQRRP